MDNGYYNQVKFSQLKKLGKSAVAESSDVREIIQAKINIYKQK